MTFGRTCDEITPLVRGNESTPRCAICGGATDPLCEIKGVLRPDTFRLRRCTSCQFAFVTNPRTDLDAIYTPEYYAGRGADPLVDYEFELEAPDRTVRHYEWRGIVRCVGELLSLGPSTRWLDAGCGSGGLVRYARDRVGCDAVGFDEGWIAKRVAGVIPMLSRAELDAHRGQFDVITAIEVIEHVVDPLDFLRNMRALLKPGGLLFLTTGNARKFRNRFTRWSYVVPELHVSYFEPETLRRALEATGFRAHAPGRLAGFTDIIRFKALKNLRVRRRSALEAALPWSVLSRALDAYAGVTEHPVGFAI